MEYSEKIKENKRKFKKTMLRVTLLLLLVSMIVCNAIVINLHINESEKKFASLESAVASPDDRAESDSDNTGDGGDEAGFKDKDESKKAVDENSVYYGLKYTDLWDNKTHDDEAVKLLAGITGVYYGTAGSSLQLIARGADLLTVAKKGEEAWEAVPAYLDTLTAAQLDFLSFRLFDAYSYAEDIINGGRAYKELKYTGVDPETCSDCTAVQLVRFMGYMVSLFDERDVEYEWEA